MSYIGVPSAEAEAVVQPDGSTAYRQKIRVVSDDREVKELLIKMTGLLAAMWEQQGEAFGVMRDPVKAFDNIQD